MYGISINICKNGTFWKPNKFWELQITTDFDGPYFNFQVNWTKKCDHAGFTFLIGIHKFLFDFKIYDVRHWNYEDNNYETK